MQGGPACDESHIDPIALPRLPENITQYYRDVVDECRAEGPNERPATRRLLERFPYTSDPESSQTRDFRAQKHGHKLVEKEHRESYHLRSLSKDCPSVFLPV